MVSVYSGIKLEQAGTRLRSGQTKRGSPRSAPAHAGQQAATGRGLTGCPAALPAPRVPDPPAPVRWVCSEGPPKAEPPARQHHTKILQSLFGFIICRRTGRIPEQPRLRQAHGRAGDSRGDPAPPAASRMSHAVHCTAHHIPQGFAPPPNLLASELPTPAAPAPCGPEDAPSRGHSSDLRPSPPAALCNPGSSRHAAPSPSAPKPARNTHLGSAKHAATGSRSHPSPPSPDPLTGCVMAARPQRVPVPGRRRAARTAGSGKRPGSPPASNECKNKPTERLDLLCFSVPCTERKKPSSASHE